MSSEGLYIAPPQNRWQDSKQNIKGCLVSTVEKWEKKEKEVQGTLQEDQESQLTRAQRDLLRWKDQPRTIHELD